MIYRHRIGVIPARQPGEWRAADRKVDSSTPQHLIQNPNPFRAAMTVFLLMQEKSVKKLY
ncbi:phage protein NinX family protein, partial [Enterobacter cloacae complex sp. 742-ADZ3-9B]|uniref:phage protein NinX family protein n=1 Tax=Enterobacter cloacae complex sp. 742-ADZ3-9B TaxID=2511992 RepID=UPI0035156FC7